MGLITRWITGHCYLARHQAIIHGGLDPTCNLCGLDEETPWHLLNECPAVQTIRPPPDDWGVIDLLKRIYKLRFMEVPEYHNDLYQ